MNKRPAPTKQLLIELTGSNQDFISSVHHGLYETPLNAFYPHLDLDETIAFAASSWKSRQKDPCFFKNLNFRVGEDIHRLFSAVYEIGFPWLNKHKDVSDELRKKYDRSNPFNGRNLKQRLERVDPVGITRLKERLKEEVNDYVFECQYYNTKMARGGDNYKLEIMGFQPVYPKRGVIVPNFASEIARIFRNYPDSYKPLSLD